MQTADVRASGALQRALRRSLTLVAAVAGLVYGYDFGKLIGGPIVGVVLALNGAVFCSIMAGALAEKLCRWGPRVSRPVGRSPG